MSPELKLFNPYWDEIKHLPAFMGKVDCYTSMDTFRMRDLLTCKYSWAIPTVEAIGFIQKHTNSIVEIGAGTGYWAYLLNQVGVDVVAYDIAPPDGDKRNEYHSKFDNKVTYHPVLKGDATAVKQYKDRTLFLCWPPMSNMAYTALRHYMGSKVIYIGEVSGCTADEKFFKQLAKRWEAVDEFDIKQWVGLHDYMQVFTRKERGNGSTVHQESV